MNRATMISCMLLQDLIEYTDLFLGQRTAKLGLPCKDAFDCSNSDDECW